MLEARNLTKRYGDFTALHPLNLTVRPGDIYCLLGANGAGKSTTINPFLDFIEPCGGAAFIPPRSMAARQRLPPRAASSD